MFTYATVFRGQANGGQGGVRWRGENPNPNQVLFVSQKKYPAHAGWTGRSWRTIRGHLCLAPAAPGPPCVRSVFLL